MSGQWDTGSGYRDPAGGRWRSALRRVFGDGENFFSWGLPLYRLWGIRVRIHLLFVVFIVARLIATLPESSTGLAFVAPFLAVLFLIVLLHEYGHCFACRMVGGEADQIVMWPLGGLASCTPPHRWRADLITTLGGPMVNVALLPVLAGLLLALTGDIRTVVFNPFAAALAEVSLRDGRSPWWLLMLWSAHFANLIILLFNMLVPMYPMDAGRVVQALLWRRVGYRKSMMQVTMVGFVAAGVLGVLGIVANQTMLLGIAVFGGVTCYVERRRLKFLEHGAVPGVDFADASFLPRQADEDEAEEPSRGERRRTRRAEADQVELDAILAKIGASGMDSLTAREKRVLKRATRRSRESEGAGG